MDDFEREIELELKRVIDPLVGSSIPQRRTAQSRATRTRALVGGAGAAIAMKLATGVVAAAAAVTVAGAATTGSLDPGVWGQQVSNRVQECKAALADGHHGIGQHCYPRYPDRRSPAGGPQCDGLGNRDALRNR